MFTPQHLARRQGFYRTSSPEKVSPNTMLAVYRDIIRAHGFELEWHFLRPRWFMHYLVLKVRRVSAAG